MQSLKKFLHDKGYIRVPLTITKTNHLEIVAKINGIEGRFILDTGASSTCVGMDSVEHFKLRTQESEIKASGAGASNMLTQISKKNSIEISKWFHKKIKIVLFDLSHVNNALIRHEALPVHGIIGADILKKSKAIIDYHKKAVFLKP
ncbi:retropepsin-like aspartic protease [Galbibacter sp.]|uniref:retropepsin-like aspartic protease n=1 Tax=Galbibacter sp. TaxID=2918471 RepID=UPI002D1FAAED|nr:retropepsin-like aspartic protease [Galbibacter sp.]